MTLSLSSIDRCFQRTLPGVIATCDRQGTPNVNYVTQIHVIDERHLALSYQFSTKTRQNLEENPHACLEVYDPLTLDAYRIQLRFDRAEDHGPLFEMLSYRIEALTSHTGLTDIFKLRAAYVCEVLAIERRNGFIEEAEPEAPPPVRSEGLSELRGMQLVSARINRASDLDTLLTETLAALDEVFGFTHGMILVPEGDGRLVTIAIHGYGDAKVGAEVKVGEGLIGVVAKTRKLLRILGMEADLRHARAVRAQFQRRAPAAVGGEIPLPGLPDASSQMAIPLLVQDRLLGVLALESRDTLMFSQWHEAFLQVLANQIASGMDRMSEHDDEEPAGADGAAAAAAPVRRSFVYYRNDDCVFVDGEYLIRNVPGKILWKLLRSYDAEQRTEYSNRELRLDPSLGLPAFKDNLESRLILLRKRLEQKCPEVQLVPTRRGRFTLAVTCTVELTERDTA
jgi:adenylate cyclase